MIAPTLKYTEYVCYVGEVCSIEIGTYYLENTECDYSDFKFSLKKDGVAAPISSSFPFQAKKIGDELFFEAYLDPQSVHPEVFDLTVVAMVPELSYILENHESEIINVVIIGECKEV